MLRLSLGPQLRVQLFMAFICSLSVLVLAVPTRHSEVTFQAGRLSPRGSKAAFAAQAAGGPAESSLPTQKLSCALWRVDGGFSSTIRIKNSLVVGPVEVTPVLNMADGTEYSLSPIEIATAGVASVNVNAALASAPANILEHLSAFGSAELRYEYANPGHVLGSMEVVNISESLIFTYPFSAVGDEAHGTVTLEGLWWKDDPGVGGFVALSNVIDFPLQAVVQAFGSSGTALAPQSLNLSPHTTRMLALDSLTAGLPTPESQEGGLRIQYDGNMGALMVAGGLANDGEGYSANIPFWFHDAGTSVPSQITYASVGFMVGHPDPAAGFPRGTRFVPYALLRNTTPGAISVALGLNYMANGQPVSADLPAQQINPYGTTELNFQQILDSLGLDEFSGELNLVASFTGRAGDIVLATGSADQTGNYVFEVEPQGVGRSFSKETAYWTVANGSDTMFTVWNPTDAAEDIEAVFFYADGSGQYKLPLQLGPKASVMIDVAQLIAAQEPDPDGNVIPPTVRDGSAVFASARGMAEWVTMAISGGIFNVQSATCGPTCIICCGWTYFRVTPDPLDVPVGGTGQMQALATQQCGGNTHDWSGDSSWSSDDTSVATVSGSGVVTGVGYGSAHITAIFPPLIMVTGQVCSSGIPICPGNTPRVTALARVRQAKWAVVDSDTGTVEGSYCLIPPAGAKWRNRYYSAYDDFGRVPFNQNFKMNENVSSSDCGAVQIDGSDFTVTFRDILSICKTGCTFQSQQTFIIEGRSVGAKDCPTCSPHIGWQVSASYNSVVVSPY